LKNPDQTKQAISYYDDFSNTYDEDRRRGYFGFINQLEFEKISPLAAGKSALEIGCGTGLILEQTHPIAELAVGVDVSPGMVDVCIEKGLNAQVIDGHNLPFADNTFDLTYSFKVLPHIPDIRQMLMEAARVTKADGRLVLEFYNTFSLKFINDKIRTWLNGDPVFIRHDTLGQFKSYMPAGWELVSVRGVRIFGIAAFCYSAPILSPFFRVLDRFFCEIPFFRGLGCYYVAEFKQVTH
jgi:ubiquinone/menaquinone biosynthesis C-methylase UbiE